MKFALLFLLLSFQAHAGTTLSNATEARRALGVESYIQSSRIQGNLPQLKIAVLDNGFGRFKHRPAGTFLPQNTELVEFYPDDMIQRYNLNPDFAGNPISEDFHGLGMAQMIYAMTGQDPDHAPKFYLLNSRGFTNFRRAIRYAIELDVDIILFSQNWEYGGAFDGEGFINAEVSRATEAGILWVNAAGNYGGTVYHSNLELNAQNYALVSQANREQDYLEVESLFDENKVKVTLAWSDVSNDYDYEAVSDLKLEVYNQNNELIRTLDRGQVLIEGDNRRPTDLAREQAEILLDRGTYKFKVKYIRGRLPANPQFRISFSNEREGIRLNGVESAREIMIPADHPQVLTIGTTEAASSVGPTTDGRVKPDFLLTYDRARFSNGLLSTGTSNAAAYFAGILALLKANNPALTRNDILSFSGMPIGYKEEVSEADFPYRVINALAETSSRLYSRSRLVRDFDNRLVVLLQEHPSVLDLYFSRVRIDAGSSGRSLGDYRYFLAPSPDGTGAYGVWSYFQPVNHDNDVPMHWIELRLESQSREGNLRVWSTPRL